MAAGSPPVAVEAASICGRSMHMGNMGVMLATGVLAGDLQSFKGLLALLAVGPLARGIACHVLEALRSDCLP